LASEAKGRAFDSRRARHISVDRSGNPMHRGISIAVVAAVLLCTSIARAGGSSYGIVPGAKALSGKISEWPVPTPKFARDPAPGPDGNIYVTVMQGDRIARFDTRRRVFNEWDVPAGAHPHGLVVDREGTVWYTGNGNGTIGELDPASGRVRQHKVPSGGSPHTLVIGEDGVIWFTNQSGSVGRLDRRTGRITEYRMSGGPYGIALDRQGNVWVCRMNADRLGRLNPATGETSELFMGSGSRPRRMAAAPDGTLWVTLYGNGRLAHVDPAASRVIKEYAMPAGADGGPYAVTVDGAGRVFASEIQSDTVAFLDPKTGKFQVFKLPSKNVGIRKAIVDAGGRFWYMGSHNGRLGMIE
jgi:virginiamycin B lyase